LIAYFQHDVGIVPVQQNIHLVRRCIGCVVEQIQQRGTQGGVGTQFGGGLCAGYLVAVMHCGAEQLPFIQHGEHELFDILLFGCFLRVSDQGVEDALAVPHLFIEELQIFLLFRRHGSVVPHFADHDRHRGERCAEFVRGAGGQCAERHDALVSECFFAHLVELCIAQPDCCCHFHGEIGDYRRADYESHPHAEYMGVESILKWRRSAGFGSFRSLVRLMLIMVHLYSGAAVLCMTIPGGQRHIPHHQQAVTGQSQRCHPPRVTARQRGDGKHQRQEIERDEWIGRATAEIEKHRQHQHINAQLQKQLRISHGIVNGQPPPGQAIDEHQKADCAQHRKPGEIMAQEALHQNQGGDLRKDGPVAQQEQSAQMREPSLCGKQ